ncbi:MAG: tyrosine-type recombinase/integrase [Candidatus Competibacterales bacterium]|nr:tyrosine-type recombinase/integrase [Candidatus Competibacterales bacterium]
MTSNIPLPLERLSTATVLDGTRGSNRAGPGTVRQIAADNDLQALQTWLDEFHDSPRTQRHYRKEAERLLLWALLERGKALSSLTREDCLAYEVFLSDPQPRERWCGPRAPRYSPGWRPFQGPLSASSRRTALLIVNSLFSYLVKAGYLSGNPLALIKRRRRQGSARVGVERFLEHDQWQSLWDTVETLPKDSDSQQRYYERARFLLALLYLLGPRVSEIAGHTMGSFIEVRGRWWWQVTGKGAKTARVPVNRDMIQALQRYRRFLGLGPMPAPGDPCPLALNLKGTAGISDNMIYRIVKDLVRRAAARLEAEDPYQAEKLRRASTHWLRHTSITHQADAGIQLRHLQRSARHAKLDTTGLYLHAEDVQWHEAMEQHRLGVDIGNGDGGED